ncbi:MAG: SBBP repeat-containing protein [Acidobacteriota bacterium]
MKYLRPDRSRLYWNLAADLPWAALVLLLAWSSLSSQPTSRRTSLGVEPRKVSPTAQESPHVSPASVTPAWHSPNPPFEANQGQTDPEVQFLSRGKGYQLFLTSTETVLRLKGPKAATSQGEAVRPGQKRKARGVDLPTPAVLRMQLVNGNPKARLTGLGKLEGQANYFTGSHPSGWRTGVNQYQSVKSEAVYPGVDLITYSREGRLEYDFVVSPGADPAQIGLRFKGAESVEIDGEGRLVVRTTAGPVCQPKPWVYQEFESRVRREVAGRYMFRPNGVLGFEVGEYDPGRPLVIDPSLLYSSYLGGSAEDDGLAVAVSPGGEIVVAGQTASLDFPTSNPVQAANSGSVDAFVVRLDASGSTLLSATYLGGGGFDQGATVALDGAGNIYVGGTTFSSNFPTVNAIQSALGGSSDAFLAELNSAGSALLYSTYLGGSGTEEGRRVAVDSSANAVLVGFTNSSNFPTANALQPSLAGGTDAFVSKIGSGGSPLLFSTYLGGTSNDRADGVALDSSGSVYLTGKTLSVNFPTLNPFQAAIGGGEDAFITKLNAAGSGLLYSTYLGGSFADAGRGIAVDSSGNAYVAGEASSADFPSVNPLQSTLGGGFDAFVSKLAATGNVLLYSTFLGGGDVDLGFDAAVDASGAAYVTGRTFSTNFPLVSPVQAAFGGSRDAFVAKIYPSGSALLFSSYLGGTGVDQAHGLALGSAGDLIVTGATDSTDFPLVSPLQASYGGGFDGFVSRLSTPPVLSAQIQPPINPNGSSIFNARRGVVPVKFVLSSNGTGTCDLPPATIAVIRTSGSSPGPVNESEYQTPADDGSNFRISNCQYLYNLGASTLGSGSYLVQIKIGGIVVGSTTFGLN